MFFLRGAAKTVVMSVLVASLVMACGDDNKTTKVYQFGPGSDDAMGSGDDSIYQFGPESDDAMGNDGANEGMPGINDGGGAGGNAMTGGMEPEPMEPEPMEPEPMEPEPMEPEPMEPGNGMMSGGGADTPGVLGAACANNGDCETGLCVAGLPGGYCSSVCQNAEDCGPGGSCWNLGQAEKVCLKDCMDSSECREGDGYICDGDNTCFPSGNAGGGGGAPPGENPEICERPDIACVGEAVADFSLINCGTGQPVSMRAHFANQRAGMFVLTTGWCPGCASWVPQVVMLQSNPMAEGLKVAFILGEDTNHGQPTQRYCQQYAGRYGVDINNIFLDHDGSDSFRTIFSHMWPYIGADGSFGLPFNAILDPTTWEYIYADRGPGGDLNAALSRLLQ
jgi:hypothetical protein